MANYKHKGPYNECFGNSPAMSALLKEIPKLAARQTTRKVLRKRKKPAKESR